MARHVTSGTGRPRVAWPPVDNPLHHLQFSFHRQLASVCKHPCHRCTISSDDFARACSDPSFADTVPRRTRATTLQTIVSLRRQPSEVLSMASGLSSAVPPSFLEFPGHDPLISSFSDLMHVEPEVGCSRLCARIKNCCLSSILPLIVLLSLCGLGHFCRSLRRTLGRHRDGVAASGNEVGVRMCREDLKSE
jgi:hypothetical protein